MKVVQICLAVLVSTGVVSAAPWLNARDDDPACYKCDYKNDDHGKKYGGYVTGPDLVGPAQLRVSHH